MDAERKQKLIRLFETLERAERVFSTTGQEPDPAVRNSQVGAILEIFGALDELGEGGLKDEFANALEALTSQDEPQLLEELYLERLIWVSVAYQEGWTAEKFFANSSVITDHPYIELPGQPGMESALVIAGIMAQRQWGLEPLGLEGMRSWLRRLREREKADRSRFARWNRDTQQYEKFKGTYQLEEFHLPEKPGKPKR